MKILKVDNSKWYKKVLLAIVQVKRNGILLEKWAFKNFKIHCKLNNFK